MRTEESIVFGKLLGDNSKLCSVEVVRIDD